VVDRMSERRAGAEQQPDPGADARERRRLDEELEEDRRRVAPSALRTPISRVRSVTEIIMIATTPTPPTSSPTAESVRPMTNSVPNSLSNVSVMRSCVTRPKLFGCVGAGRGARAARRHVVHRVGLRHAVARLHGEDHAARHRSRCRRAVSMGSTARGLSGPRPPAT
jgi:hypothetical protein